ncbi:MAG: 30S ribosomal protein S4 [bacterium]|nr:30S ribosomal protein S4 [bacterium]
MQQGVVRKRRPSQASEYGKQLREKQTLKQEYNLRERQFKAYVTRSLQERQEKSSPELLMQFLEQRLDNAIFRMGLAQSRPQARQLVSHGHVLVNGRPLDIPSYKVKINDVISLHPSSKTGKYFTEQALTLKKYEAPAWISLDKEKIEATVTGTPTLEDASPSVELSMVFEFYSR